MQLETMKAPLRARYITWLGTPLGSRLIRGSLAQIYNQAVTIGIQLLSVPVLLHYWGVQQYGAWLVLSAIPTYLTLADLGFAQIAGNEMSVKVGAGNRSSALEVFQSMTLLVALVAPLAVAGSALIILVVPLSDIFKLSDISHETVQAVLFIFSLQFALSLFFGVIGAGLRANGQVAKMVSLTATSRLFEQITVLLVAAAGAGLIPASSSMLCVRVGFTCIAAVGLLRNARWLSLGTEHAQWQIVKRLFFPSVAYTSYTLGNLVNIQGITLIVGAIFGPGVVASFSVMRTLTRLGPTASNIISYSLEPEYSSIYGSGGLKKYRTSVRYHAYATAALCTAYLAGMWLFAHRIIHIWTSDRVSPMEPLLTLLAIACACEMVWSSWQVPLVSINRHKIATISYLFVSIISMPVMYVGAEVFGINAIGVASVGVGLCMIGITHLRLAAVFNH
jgi:O-antigen/teichoic acid export membrane protein